MSTGQEHPASPWRVNLSGKWMSHVAFAWLFWCWNNVIKPQPTMWHHSANIAILFTEMNLFKIYQQEDVRYNKTGMANGKAVNIPVIRVWIATYAFAIFLFNCRTIKPDPIWFGIWKVKSFTALAKICSSFESLSYSLLFLKPKHFEDYLVLKA